MTPNTPLRRTSGPPTAEQWNALVDIALRRVVGVGCDVQSKANALVISVPTKPGPFDKPPFECKWNKSAGKIAITAGAYQVGVDGEWTRVAALGETEGKYAYLIIEQDANADVVDVTLEVSATEKDPTNLDAGNAFVEFSNVLLAEVVGVDDAARLVQRRNGNFLLSIFDVNGYAARWTETVIGGIPPEVTP